MSIATSSDDIRHELHLLTGRVEALERTVGQNNAAPSVPFDLASIESKVREIAQELFPGPCHFTVEFDPEYPNDRYVVVNVEATGSPQEIVERSCQWDQRIRRLSADLRDLRLFVAAI